MDNLLYTTKNDRPTVFWRPGNGRSIVPHNFFYQSFSHIVRTVHIHEALDICAHHELRPKFIYSCSSLSKKHLRYSRNHPCRNLRVLWFGTRASNADEDKHEWYGNVEFALPADILLKRWKYWFLVEMISAPTHTVTLLLITNTDYSSVLPQYDPHREGGQWVVSSQGHFVLSDCLRYNDEGYNKHGHALEFMIEVTPYGQKKILEECEISFRNHFKAIDNNRPHVCHRFQKSDFQCPSPFSTAFGSMVFFHEHQRKRMYLSLATPRLSNSAEYYRQRYLDAVSRNSISPVLGQPLQPLPVHPPGLHFSYGYSLLCTNYGLFSDRYHFEISNLITCPENVRRFHICQFMPWNVLLAYIWNQRRQKQAENKENQSNTSQLDVGKYNSQLDQLTVG
ncbi:uncharacterized protein [Panulirus ornatus]|uniref:uncharacterized protein n=1 Tax=Panulirus ornatus TaxID=150431 RepID=UPI003A868030